MSFIELVLRVYVVVSALPVLGFFAVLLVDLSVGSKRKRLDQRHSQPAT